MRQRLEFLVVNYEITWRRILDFDPDMIVADESHRIKDPRSRQSIGAYELAKGVTYRIPMTGTPTEGDETELWAQMRFMDESLLGDDWRRFEAEWCRKDGFGFHKRKVKKHLRPRLWEILGPHVVELTRDEVLDLPTEEDYVIPFELTGKAKRAYRELEDHLRTEIAGEVVVTPMRVQQMIKLQQVTGGFLHTEDATIRMEQDKLATMHDWLQEYKGTKIVVFARFLEEIEAMRWLFSKTRTVGVLTGKTKDRSIWEQFQDHRDPEMLLCQIQTGGVSLELSSAEIGVFYSRTFSFTDYDQARARLIGKNKLLFGHLIGENTVDQDVFDVVSRKGKSAKDILRNLKRRSQ